MIDRNKRGIRSTGVRARLAIAAAVLVGGSAAGVVALSANHGSATTAQSAGFMTGNHHRIGESVALSEALASWNTSPTQSLNTLTNMAPMRTFSQVWHHGTMFAVQRGIVLLATKKFIVVKSLNGSVHLWWTSGATRFQNVSSASTGMAAMTGSMTATTTAMTTGNMTPVTNVMVGSTGAVTQMMTPTAKPTTITIATGGQIITITVASATATVTQPTVTTTAAPIMTTAKQSVFTSTKGVHRGDLVFIAGTRKHGELKAQIVLFAMPTTVTPIPTVSPTGIATPSVSPSATVTPTALATRS